MLVTSFKRSSIVIFVLIIASCLAAQRQFGGTYNKDKLDNTRANVAKYDWVKDQRDAAVKAAEPWAAKSLDELWSMVPGQDLPRCIDVTWDYNYPKNPRLGCLKCGDEIYNYTAYPYNPDFEKKPWKLTCPNCGVVFPTNDFGKYYKSGLDEHGLFNPTRADRSLLFNTEHPDPKDPLHTYGVDDGFGYVDKGGRHHKFIGYYTWKYWRYIYSGLQGLGDAFVYTGEKKYAARAAVLLDRIADVYPAMDWKPYADMGWYHSDGSSHEGKIEGRIWETATIQHFARAYDKIISGTADNPEIYKFLKKKAEQYKLPEHKGTRQDLIANIDTGILETSAEVLISGRIRGNEGMHQSSMACCALALNTEPKTSDWLDWLFAADGGHIPTMMMGLFDRDGMADEAAPGYCFLWPGKLQEIMTILEPYNSYTNHSITRDFPWFRNAYRAPWQVEVLNTFLPNIGDTGAVGTINQGVRAGLMAAGFQFYGDKTAARYAWEANGNSAKGLLLDVGSTTPDLLNKQLERAALEYPKTTPVGENMAGYGLTTFEFGDDASGKSLWMYYGRNKGHGHQDRLNYSIYAFGTDLTPDLGYPEFANSVWKKRAAWNNNTISHNTVVVDQQIQKTNWTGFPRFYGAAPGFGVAEVESTNVYPQCEEYARTISFIEAPGDNAYAVDIFRVKGGKDHLLSFHGPPGEVAVSGLKLERQTTGTYAGENVAFGDNSEKYPYGYSYLKNVERDKKPPTQFTLDWKAMAGYRDVTTTDNLHMRLHVIGGDLSDVALADGVPPQNKPGNPKSIRYALLHRKGHNASLKTQFVSVAEPWKDEAFIRSISPLAMAAGSSENAVGLKIEMKDGSVDYVLSNPDRKIVSTVDGLKTDGEYSWFRIQDDFISSGILTRGTKLSWGDIKMIGPGNIAGYVVRFEKDPKKSATVWIEFSKGDPSQILKPHTLPAQIIFDNDRQRNACYDIESVEKDGGLWKVTCGPGSFVRGFVDDADYGKGYRYNISEGAKCYVPVTTIYSKENL